tara:strand:+ start:194 stop:838 length:645 start_codon:yes stop_codon:yes gene_type:complete
VRPYYQDDAVTIYHGDCREILPQLENVDLVLTDPPYGISLDTDYTRFRSASARNWNEIITGDTELFEPAFLTSVGKTACLFGANYYSHRLPVGKWLIWNKRDEGPSRVLADGEMAWHNGPGKTVQVFNWFWIGCYRKGEMKQEPLHPTQKPEALMRWCVETLSTSGVILDPFMGSGTTLRAAKDLGRKAIGIEIEEKYCEIAANRMSQMVMPLA